MCYCNRRIFRAMLSSVDAMLTNLTVAMKAKGLWQDTLVFYLGELFPPIPCLPMYTYVYSCQHTCCVHARRQRRPEQRGSKQR